MECIAIVLIVLGMIVSVSVLCSFWNYDIQINSAAFIVFVTLGALFVANVIYDPWEVSEERLINKWEIVAVSDTSVIEGRMLMPIFITTGYIDQKLVYYVYKRDTATEYIREQVDSSAKIVESDEPSLEFYGKVDDGCRTRKWPWWRFVRICKTPELTKKVIKVPKGTIIEEFKLDNG